MQCMYQRSAPVSVFCGQEFGGWSMKIHDSPDVVIAKQLMVHRVGDEWVDLIHIKGFSRDCFAWRKCISSLLVSEDALVQRRVEGSALDVLNEVLPWEPDLTVFHPRIRHCPTTRAPRCLFLPDQAGRRYCQENQERGAMPGRHRFRRIATLREILDRSRRARPPAVLAPVCTVEFADGPTGIAHRVTAAAFAAGRRAGGRYVALCGAQVLPERLTAPARVHCPACERGL
jgi:hypothetical protein